MSLSAVCIQLSSPQWRPLAFCSTLRFAPAVQVGHQLLRVHPQVAVGVAHQPEIRRLADQHAAVEHLQRARRGSGRRRTPSACPSCRRGSVSSSTTTRPIGSQVRLRRGEIRHEARHLDDPQPARRHPSRSRSDPGPAARWRRARGDSPAAWRTSSSPRPATAPERPPAPSEPPGATDRRPARPGSHTL